MSLQLRNFDYLCIQGATSKSGDTTKQIFLTYSDPKPPQTKWNFAFKDMTNSPEGIAASLADQDQSGSINIASQINKNNVLDDALTWTRSVFKVELLRRAPASSSEMEHLQAPCNPRANPQTYDCTHRYQEKDIDLLGEGFPTKPKFPAGVVINSGDFVCFHRVWNNRMADPSPWGMLNGTDRSAPNLQGKHMLGVKKNLDCTSLTDCSKNSTEQNLYANITPTAPAVLFNSVFLNDDPNPKSALNPIKYGFVFQIVQCDNLNLGETKDPYPYIDTDKCYSNTKLWSPAAPIDVSKRINLLTIQGNNLYTEKADSITPTTNIDRWALAFDNASFVPHLTKYVGASKKSNVTSEFNLKLLGSFPVQLHTAYLKAKMLTATTNKYIQSPVQLKKGSTLPEQMEIINPSPEMTSYQKIDQLALADCIAKRDNATQGSNWDSYPVLTRESIFDNDGTLFNFMDSRFGSIYKNWIAYDMICNKGNASLEQHVKGDDQISAHNDKIRPEFACYESKTIINKMIGDDTSSAPINLGAATWYCVLDICGLDKNGSIVTYGTYDDLGDVGLDKLKTALSSDIGDTFIPSGAACPPVKLNVCNQTFNITAKQVSLDNVTANCSNNPSPNPGPDPNKPSPNPGPDPDPNKPSFIHKIIKYVKTNKTISISILVVVGILIFVWSQLLRDA